VNLVLISGQHALQEIRLRTQLRHQNVLPFLGITTKFVETLSIVSRWMERNAHDYVQDESVDPRPLVGLCSMNVMACFTVALFGRL